MRILLVHGRAQGGKDLVQLRTEWLDALHDGFAAAGLPVPPGVSYDLPYYGDLLDTFVSGANLPSSADVAAKGPSGGDPFESFMKSVLLELQATHPALDEATVRAAVPGQDLGSKGAENWRWVHAIARTVDRHFSGAVDFTIERFLKDVFLYVSSRPVRKAIDQVVVDSLTDEPTIVVGHSLGSVVGYNVIKERRQSLDLVKYVTVGSPLGLKAITAKLGIPVNLAADGWFNAYDADDIVALVPLDANHFPTRPPVENDGTVDNPTGNQHGISGYLTHPTVARTIAEAVVSVPQ